jgi:Asp-tRNA(Asn)/Glu-tRNA(Gln) amidotransferase A subunit family amidase
VTSLHTLGLREIVSGVRDKRWSAVEVVRAHAKRIEGREPEVQAWEHLDLERATALAAKVDSAGGHAVLAGAPIAVKDIIDVAGMPTRYGSQIYAEAAPSADSAECVAALMRAGAIVLGKSVTTEFAYYFPGKTRNPWNARHTPGGSSMGSAASVACGMAAGALGTQTNGSVIRPAAFCGIVGYKPSFGIVSNDGTLDPWPTLDHTGVFARNVRDAALLASVIARPNAVSAAVRVPSQPPKLAVVRSPVWHLAEAAQKATLETSAKTFADAGAAVEHVELPPEFAEAHRVHRVVMAYEGARHFHDLQRRSRPLMSARFNELLDEGAAIDERDYVGALRAAQALRESYRSWMNAFDAVLTPPATGEAPATIDETGSPAFCTIWTLLGGPAITVPAAAGPAGLPIGIQLVGTHFRDDRLLGAAAWCEARLPGYPKE